MATGSHEASWSGSFERETFTVALADFVRDMVPALLERPRVRDRYSASESERVLAEFEFERWGQLAVLAVGARDRFVLYAKHDEFELVTQVAFGEDLVFDALRIATFRGDLTTALLWCRALRETVGPRDQRHPRWAAHLH
ncbi:MAG: hypothetical protein AAF799_21430 [Myxococcota bacterium]